MGPLIKPFSTSFTVAAKRLRSVSLFPELCTDSRGRHDWGLKLSWDPRKSCWPDETSDWRLLISAVLLLGQNLSWCHQLNKSSWPASLRSVFRRHSLLSLSTSAILGLSEDFKPPSLVTSSVDKATHLLTSSVRSWTTWWTVWLDRYAMLALTSFAQRAMFCWMAKTNCFIQELFKWKMHSYRDLIVSGFFGTRDIPPFGSAE